VGSETFLAGIFPDTALQILPYNRVVQDLHGHSSRSLLDAIAASFTVVPNDEAPPRGTIAMYLDRAWYHLTPHPDQLAGRDEIARLDVSVLQDLVLGPLLGIDDPRRSKRIQFVGGIRPVSTLTTACERGGVAFRLHPTGLDQLFAVADAGGVMPPKSTWFEPKLREGVVSQRLDGTN
jgi:uncharacterized protein (DUF1015 family)